MTSSRDKANPALKPILPCFAVAVVFFLLKSNYDKITPPSVEAMKFKLWNIPSGTRRKSNGHKLLHIRSQRRQRPPSHECRHSCTLDYAIRLDRLEIRMTILIALEFFCATSSPYSSCAPNEATWSSCPFSSAYSVSRVNPA